MKTYDVIIIGAGPSGIVAGVTTKKQNPEKSILMIKEEEKGLIPCGIPYIFHDLGNLDKNVMSTKPLIDLGGNVIVDPVVKVDVSGKIVTVKSGDSYEYDKLIFATGSIPVIPTFIPGYDLKGVEYIRKSYNYIKELKKKTDQSSHIVIVGGGFIGAEVAEQLALQSDKTITIIESKPYCFNKAFSEELSKIATKKLKETNINVFTSTLVKEVLGENGKVTGVLLNTGEIIKAELIIMSIGYKPNTEIARKAGLELNSEGAIKVDNFEKATVKDVCAIGDCSQTLGFITGRLDHIMLASTAAAEARVLGYNLFGIKIRRCCTGTIGIFSTQINGLSMAAVGVNETNGREYNIEFVYSEFSDFDTHPGNFKNTSSLTVKLYASSSDGSILGGEVWGGKSTGEIINIIGMAIQKRVTVFELVSYQIGTHPLLTPAPTKYVLIKAAEGIITKLNTSLD
ncbi:MAG: FAD-dependent oxidoreductase [Bacteroidales bacterium]|nr:FAD-dependent oxidoreductase [Bacteroidales bacterium]